jgi:hypothetical protein
MAQSAALPVIDISRFRAPDADRDAFLAELRSAAHEVGFFYVTGHGVPAALREEVLSAARRFFALPEEQRLEIENLNSPQFSGYTRTGDPTHNGLSFWDSFSDLGLAYALRLRTRLVRDLGPDVSPFNSFLLLQGLETLSLRIERHVSNTQSLAEWLVEQPQGTRAHYAGLPSSPCQTQAKRYLPRGSRAVLAFELAGGLEAGRRFVEGVRLFSHLANIGDAGQQAAAGATPGPGAAVGRDRGCRRPDRRPRSRPESSRRMNPVAGIRGARSAMRRSTALRLAATSVLAGLAATACGTGAADDPANTGPSSRDPEPTAIDTGATVDVRLVLEPTSPDTFRLAKNATYDLVRYVANDDRTVTGTPREIADPIEEWFHGRAADGFIATFPYLPGSLDAFAEPVIPELRRRGLFRTHYTGRTLRDHLGLPRPSRRA